MCIRDRTEFEAGIETSLQRHAPELATRGQYDTFSYIGQHAPGYGIKGGENIRMYNMPPEGSPQQTARAQGLYQAPSKRSLLEGTDPEGGPISEWEQRYMERTAPDIVSDEPTRYGDIFLEQRTGEDWYSGMTREEVPYTAWHERVHRGARLALPRAIKNLEQYRGVLDKDQSSWTKEDKELHSLYQDRAGGSTIEEVDRSLSILRGIYENEHPYIYAVQAEHGPEENRGTSELRSISDMDEKEYERWQKLLDEHGEINDREDMTNREKLEAMKRNSAKRQKIKDRARDWRADRIKEWEEAQNIVEDMLSQDESKTRLQRVRDFFFN